MTDEPADFSRLHDEPSRCLRLFPGEMAGNSAFTLFEDDGISAAGPVTRLRCDLSWTTETVTLSVEIDGPVPAGLGEIGVSLPLADRRRLVLRGQGVTLKDRPFRPTVEA
jgi:alpha-glucosidase